MTDTFRLPPTPAPPKADAPTAKPAELGDELQARRAAQRKRAERVRLGEADRELGNGCPECGPANPVTHVAGEQSGWVPVLVEVPAGARRNPQPYTQVHLRPCFTCNRARWEAWQLGDLAGARSRTSPADIKATERQRLR
jgi:hypothetical protein